MQIVAVAMLDWQRVGADRFFVQIDDENVMLYEVSESGVTPVVDEPAPLVYITGSIEKFGSMYRLEEPVAVDNVEDLPGFLGKFEIHDEVSARYLDYLR